MINKNDPLVAAIQKVMQSNQAERDAIASVNEKFGVTDRRALPRERQHEWDSAYSKVLTEGAEGSIPRTPKERELARAYGDPTRITHGDVLRKRGVSEGKMTKSDIAALKHPKKKITGDDLAALRAGEHKKMEEEKKMKGDDPCWDNYEMIGMKKKGGKEVPNCVPVKEEGVPGKAITGDTVTGSGSVTPVPVPKPKPTIGDADRKQLTDKIKSIVKEATENQKNKVGEVMREFKRRELHSGKGGPVVTDPKQAIAISLSKAGISKVKKKKAKKKLEEGFNDRHDSSVNASVSEQVVADQFIPMGGSAPGTNLRNKIRQVGQSQRFRPRGSPTSSVNVSSKGPVSQKPGINAATGSMNATVDQRRAGYNITNVRDTAYGANPTAKKLGPASSTGGEGPSAVPAPNRAVSGASRPGPSFERTGRGGNPSLTKPSSSPSFEKTGRGGNPSLAAKSTAGKDRPGTGPGQGSGAPGTSRIGKDRPGTGPGQGSGAPTGPENIKMATQKAADDFKFTDKERAGKVSAERLNQFYQQKGLKSSGKTTQDLRTFMNAAKNKTLNTKVTPATELQKANQAKLQAGRTTTTSSVAGGQGIAAVPGGGSAMSAASTPPKPTARPANVGSAGPASPTMATNAQAAGQMAIDRMRAQNIAKSQTPSMSAGMSRTAPAPKSTPPKPLSGGAGR